MTTDEDPPVPEPSDPAAADQACAAAMRQASLLVPADRWAGTVAGYVELRAMARLLRADRPAEAEPAAVFRVARPSR